MSLTDANVPDVALITSKPIEPKDKGGYEVFGPIQMGQFRMRYMTLKLEYMSKWWNRHRDVARYINPRRGFFDGYIPNYNLQIDHKLVIDGTPQRCIRTGAAGMQSGLSTPDQLWFQLGLPDKDMEKWSPIKEWLEQVRDILMRIFADSNLYETLHQSYEEEFLFGTSAFQIDEDFDTVMRCRAFTAGEYYLGNDAKGRLNAFARFHWMTVDQIVNEFGWKNCSTRIQNAYSAGRRDDFFQLFSIIQENTTKDEGKLGWEGMKYNRVCWEADLQDDKCLDRGGYNEFPVVATRWDLTTTADTYGVGPGMYAIGDVKSSYRMKKEIWLAEAKKVSPPVMIHSSVQGIPNMEPNGVTYTSSATPDVGAKAAYQVDSDTKGATELWGITKQDLREWFYTDLFQTMISAPDDTKKTAAEIAARHEAMLRLLGPVLERQYGKFKALINRAFMIGFRARTFPPPPREIQGMPLIPRFISVLAQAQQMVKGNAIERGMSFLNNMMPTFPEAKDNVDIDVVAREYLSVVGVPASAIRSPDAVQAIRDQQAQKQQQLEQQQTALAAVSAAKNLSGTPVGDRSALEHLVGSQPGQAGNA